MKGELCIKSGYTFLSSTLKIEDIINIAKENKYEYLSLVDKEVMFGAMEFYLACKKNDIKKNTHCTAKRTVCRAHLGRRNFSSVANKNFCQKIW